MKKLELTNIALILIILMPSLIFFIWVGLGELIATIRYGHDDFYGLGLPQLIASIFSTIYLIMAIKVYKSNKINNLIKKAYWVNISGFILFVIGVIILSLVTLSCRINDPYGECLLRFIILGFLLTFILLIFTGISFIIFLVGYFKK